MHIYSKDRGANRISFCRGVFRNKMGGADFGSMGNAVFDGGCAFHVACHNQLDIRNRGIFLLNRCILVKDRDAQICGGREFLVPAVQIDIEHLTGHFHRCGNIHNINRHRGLHHIAAPFALHTHQCFTGFNSLNNAVFINRYCITGAGVGVFHI